MIYSLGLPFVEKQLVLIMFTYLLTCKLVHVLRTNNYLWLKYTENYMRHEGPTFVENVLKEAYEEEDVAVFALTLCVNNIT